MRISEFAKGHGTDSRSVLSFLADHGHEGLKASSSVPADFLTELNDQFPVPVPTAPGAIERPLTEIRTMLKDVLMVSSLTDARLMAALSKSSMEDTTPLTDAEIVSKVMNTPEPGKDSSEEAESESAESGSNVMDLVAGHEDLIDTTMRPASELAVEVSELMGEPVSAEQVLDTLGIIADEDHAVDVDAPEVVNRLLRQRELLDSSEGGFGELLHYYWDNGLIGLSVPVAQHLFRGRVEGVSSLGRDSDLSEAQRETAVAYLTSWSAICLQLKRDRSLPKRGTITRTNQDQPVERQWYEFTGRCGHTVRQKATEVERYRAINENVSAPIYQELCDDCLQKRARLLFTPPDAVNPEIPETLACKRCGGDLFAKGPGSAFKSRSDRYLNAMSGTTSVIALFNGLKSEHPFRNKVCAETMRKQAEEQSKTEKEREKAVLMACDNMIADRKQEAFEAMDDNSAHRKAIMAGLPERIREIRQSFGLPEDEDKYQNRRVKAGLVKRPAKKTTSKSAVKS